VWLEGSGRDSEAGEVWRFWTEPPDVSGMEGEIRRRADGQPYTPEWRAPDRVVIYDPEDERCIGLVELISGPDWCEDEAVFWQRARVLAWPGSRGPLLADCSARKPMQGGRYRLGDTEYDQIHDAIGLPPWSRAGDTIRYRILPDGEPTTKKLITGKSGEGELSTASPLGRALVGRSVGEEIRVVLPRGPVQVEILDVKRDD
jgi:hypothetical protein